MTNDTPDPLKPENARYGCASFILVTLTEAGKYGCLLGGVYSIIQDKPNITNAVLFGGAYTLCSVVNFAKKMGVKRYLDSVEPKLDELVKDVKEIKSKVDI